MYDVYYVCILVGFYLSFYTLKADLEGKFVVLEWLNFGCPYVIRHYNSGNMPELQKEFTGKDVVCRTCNPFGKFKSLAA